MRTMGKDRTACFSKLEATTEKQRTLPAKIMRVCVYSNQIKKQ